MGTNRSTFTSLPNGNPTAYKLLLEFLTHGHLPIIEANPIDHIDLFTLTTGTLPLQPFRNHVLDSFLHHITTSPSSSSSSIPYHLIPKLYAATAPHSSLRHLLVDVVINTGSAADVAAWNAAARLPREFLTDCWDLAAKQGIQPCANAQPEAWAWVREKAARFCSEDHVHDGVEEAIVRFDGAQGVGGGERREHARVLRCMEEEAEQRMRYFLSWRHTRVRY